MTKQSKSNTVVVAPTRDQGRWVIRTAGDRLRGAHIVTPRSLNSLRGVKSIEKIVVAEGMELSADFIAMLYLSLKIA